MRRWLWMVWIWLLPYGFVSAAHKWVVYYAQGIPKHAQAYEVTKEWEEMASAIEKRWRQGYDLIALSQGYTRWAAVFEKDTGMRGQSYAVRGDREVFFKLLRRKIAEGEAPIEIAYGEGVFVGIFAKGKPVPKLIIEDHFDRMGKKIVAMWREGYVIDFVRYYEGHWIATMIKKKHAPIQTIERTRTWAQFDRLMQQRWREGYYLTDLHYGFGDWVGTFTKTKRYDAQAYDLANGWGALGEMIWRRWKEGWRIVGISEGW